ncbi:hypothetical protein NtRootA4_05450 [Arthrobacter sp. NtRootA4]|nr:hypothetical protein NtRootA2_07680 [Arthrobacter sp. NtRootA2]BCW13566.1 hypothetical protein NtRootA4_05450 [Arthrobacter sp. NtRootA4]BCW21902.1 hypothetical protein NtRootC7_07690 [Arthrobacter sp. NtRootC7]BCW26169.1 hypothetical protein NtRootC45_07690 [Arthrobacter sp. NtRootC45]BCW30439.1 hypothetical protein NtRootD5_07700 [Arthrobacter sp. NtRootD5]
MFGQTDIADDGNRTVFITALAQEFVKIGQHLTGIDLAILVRFPGSHHDDPEFAITPERDAEGEEAAILLEMLLGGSEASAQGLPELAVLG